MFPVEKVPGAQGGAPACEEHGEPGLPQNTINEDVGESGRPKAHIVVLVASPGLPDACLRGKYEEKKEKKESRRHRI